MEIVLILIVALVVMVIAFFMGAIYLRALVMKKGQTHDVENDERTQHLVRQLNETREQLREQSARLDERERRLNEREDQFLQNSEVVRKEADRIQRQRHELSDQQRRLDAEEERLAQRCEMIAQLTRDEAVHEVMEEARREATARAHHLAKSIEDEALRSAQRSARKIIATAIERVAVTQTTESVMTSVSLPHEEMKGRIIGREGRNVRTFEQITGVTILIDDTPGTVLLSCFDPVRREIARQTLTALVEDGRIHPSSIEQAYAHAVEAVEETCLKAADDALEEAGIVGIDPRLRPTIGALKYRTSYGQNVLAHCVETAQLAGAMAAEIGADIDRCKRAAFLHDLGKAVITSGDGSHALEGAELARRYGEDEIVVHAIAAHHNEIEAVSVEDVLTQAADAISGARPGARRESLEAYIQRLEKLEEVALAQQGVDKAFALQAGREIRVMVLPEMVDDQACDKIAHEIAEQVEKEVTYPGRIKVTVIRESRSTVMAH